jgi:hypothetical protein
MNAMVVRVAREFDIEGVPESELPDGEMLLKVTVCMLYG